MEQMGNKITADRTYMAALVRRAQENDSDAFAELYALTYEAQYAFTRKYLRDDYYAQDAIQEVYIAALKNIKKLKEPFYFNTWLRQINLRVCYDMAMERKRRSASGDKELEIVVDKSAASNPEEMVFKILEHEKLTQALMQLSVKERNAIILKYTGNMSLNDIADYMECSISSVTRYLNRGYKELREMLGTGYF